MCGFYKPSDTGYGYFISLTHGTNGRGGARRAEQCARLVFAPCEGKTHPVRVTWHGEPQPDEEEHE